MTAPHASEILNGYLARLEAEAAGLPRRERQDLIERVRVRITAARSWLVNETDADLLNLLDRLGDPAQLVAEELDRLGLSAPQPTEIGLVEIGALALTPLIWPVGVILLWASNAWNVRDKLIGTLVPPGGLLASYAAFGLTLHLFLHDSLTFVSLLFLVSIMLSPVFTGIYLAMQLHRRPISAGRLHMCGSRGRRVLEKTLRGGECP
jgi:hypothetical protein